MQGVQFDDSEEDRCKGLDDGFYIPTQPSFKNPRPSNDIAQRVDPKLTCNC